MNPITRQEMFLAAASGEGGELPKPITREEMYLKAIAENGGGGGTGTTNYNALSNKPQIGGIELKGNKSLSDLGIPTKTSQLTNDDNVVKDASYVHTDNNYDATAKNIVDGVNAALSGKVDNSKLGAVNGVAQLGEDGKLLSSQMPGSIDHIIEAYYNVDDGKFYEEATYETEIAPQSSVIYVSLDTNKTYRWSGTQYVEISESLALGETAQTAYPGNKGKANADAINGILDGANIDSFGDVETALSGKINTTSRGAANGVAGLDANGKVPTEQLPALLALGETAQTAYAGDKGKANADAITAIKDGTNIDSFADVETALGLKQNKTLDTSISVRGESKTTVEATLGALNNALGKTNMLPSSYTSYESIPEGWWYVGSSIAAAMTDKPSRYSRGVVYVLKTAVSNEHICFVFNPYSGDIWFKFLYGSTWTEWNSYNRTTMQAITLSSTDDCPLTLNETATEDYKGIAVAYQGTIRYRLIFKGGHLYFTSYEADGTTKIVNDMRIDIDAYSTSEIITNKVWINNKPIYRKVYTGLNMEGSSNDWKDFSGITPPSGLSSLISASVIRNDNVACNSLAIKVASNKIQYINQIFAATSSSTTLILEYTKA